MISYKYPSKDPIVKLKNTMSSNSFNNRTITSYTYYIEALLKHTGKSPKNHSADDIINYLEKLVTEKKSRSTLNTAHSAFKYYFGQILNRKFFAPHGKIERAKLEKKQPIILSEKEVEKIIKVTFNQKYKLLFELMYKTGLKPSEIVNIKIEDLDFINNLIIIKTDNSRKIEINNNLTNELNKYINERSLDNYLFNNSSGKKLSVRSIQNTFLLSLKRANIYKPANCYSLRHSFAMNLGKNGYNSKIIQEKLGHKLTTTSKKYIELTEKKELSIKNTIKKLIRL